jgi:hypothetical protein
MSEEQRSSPEYLKDGLDEGKFMSVHTLEDHFERDLVRQALAEAGIPHAIRLAGDTEFALIFADAQGYGRVLVHASDAEAARQICIDIRESDAEAAETVKQMFE